MALTLGQVLRDRYRIDRLIAKGGMGAVYAAHDLNLGIPCALKENGLITQEAMRQFEREARLLATLRHSNLPNVTDHFVIPGRGQYLVMSYIEGEDLTQRLKRLRHLPEEEIQRWAVDVLNALAYLHQRNIVHRDIKPANVKITPDGHAVLVDFGIAKELDAIDVTTTTGARRLTPGFAPPEQYGAGTGRTDPRSDVYALGATLYTLLTGILPADALTRLMDPDSYIPLSRPGLKIRPALAQAIDKALALDPKKRFANAQEMLDGLRRQSAESTQPVATGQSNAPAPAVNNPQSGVNAVPTTSTDPLKTEVVEMGTESTEALALLPQATVSQDETHGRRRPWWIGLATLAALALLSLFIVGRWFPLGASGRDPSTQTPDAESTLTPTSVTTSTALAGAADAAGTEFVALTLTAMSQPATESPASTQATPPAGTATRAVTPIRTALPAHATATALVAAVTQTAVAFLSTSGSISATQTASAQFTQTSAVLSASQTLPSTATRQATPTQTATARPAISLNPPNTEIVVGASTSMTVSISTAQSSDVVVSLSSSNSSAVTVPGSVVIPAGATSASFAANGQAAGLASITATLPGSLGGGSSTASVTVNKADTVTSLSANPNPATVGQQVTVSFGVSASAPGSGTPGGTVTITDEGGVLCTAGAPSGSCAFIAGPIGTKSLTASYSGDSYFNGSSSSPTSLPVNPLGVSLEPPSSCSTLSSIQLAVQITAIQAGDTTVSLSSSNGLITVPLSVTISAGSTSATFSVNGAIGQSTITATLPGPLGGASATANVRFALPLGC